MPNPIKYSTGSESDALKKGNMYIGTGSVGKGPSDVTGYYQGPAVPSGGYVIYMNKVGAPGGLSYHSAANDAELISFTNSLAGQSYTTAQQCFDYYYGQNDKVLVNQDYPADYPYIVMDGLVLNLDAGITQSYPGSGTVWTDVNGLGPKNNGTLINGPTFNSGNGGSIVFDGTDDEIVLVNSITFISAGTISAWVKYSDTSVDLTLASGNNYEEGYWFYTYSNDVYTNWGNRFVGFGPLKSSFPQNEIFYLSITLESGVNKLYKNGTLLNTVNGISPSNNGVLRSFGRLYKNGSGGYANMNGNIYCSHVYNRALSVSEVLQNYNATKGRFGL